MQERVFSSGENSGGRHWGKALFWAEDWQRRGSGRSLQLGWGWVRHSTSGSRQPAVQRPPKTVLGSGVLPRAGSGGCASNMGSSGAASRNPGQCRRTAWFNSGSWEVVGRAEERTWFCEVPPTAGGSGESRGENLVLRGAFHCLPPDVTLGHPQEPPETLL